MKLTKGLGFMILSLVVGLIATLLIHRYITLKTERKIVVKPTARVLIAETDISAGTPLSARLVKEVSWPQEIIPPKAVSSFNQVKNRVLLIPMSKGEPLLMAKLAPEGTAAGLPGILPADRLAVTVRTDDVSGVAGFIYPGSHVDVLVCVKTSDEHKEEFSKIILQNIKVLSTGKIWGQVTEADKDKCPEEVTPKVQTTATLEVTPDQAEILNLASTAGKIRLALRNNLNVAEVATPGVATSDLIHKRQAAPTKGVTVIKGVKVSFVNL
ncbi:MAG: Flp pilus assembly protein CpaB [Desulfobacca sp. 4484_104]|nr:MAG: Flp pilus assembly protein CpaB [Desulfobacca sp. 4484_104]